MMDEISSKRRNSSIEGGREAHVRDKEGLESRADPGKQFGGGQILLQVGVRGAL